MGNIIAYICIAIGFGVMFGFGMAVLYSIFIQNTTNEETQHDTNGSIIG